MKLESFKTTQPWSTLRRQRAAERLHPRLAETCVVLVLGVSFTKALVFAHCIAVLVDCMSRSLILLYMHTGIESSGSPRLYCTAEQYYIITLSSSPVIGIRSNRPRSLSFIHSHSFLCLPSKTGFPFCIYIFISAFHIYSDRSIPIRFPGKEYQYTQCICSNT